ncbi:hypothetical protein ASZ78_016251 [Callipepla squamata]|uniref:glutathione transferase n=1 Tax=Callipepla squamata TaxID=9009 RepID=A0A226N7A0_CALSU|nr:hypothetical protein ASZ78_016251 [Callipepla squamata]
MSGKPRLTYINGRGRMETIRWLLSAAGVEFEEVFLQSREQLLKLVKVLCGYHSDSPSPCYCKPPHANSRQSFGSLRIDMYVEGVSDLMQLILMFPFTPPEAKEKNLASIAEKATGRYFPVFEKVLKQHGQDFLVGNRFSWADVALLEAILAVEEKVPSVLSGFPQLQAFKTKMSNMPTIKKFLQPGSPRKPPPDERYVATVMEIFKLD